MVVVVVVVGSDALLSSSPSLIWLQLGFGLAGAVTILCNDTKILHKDTRYRYVPYGTQFFDHPLIKCTKTPENVQRYMKMHQRHLK